MKVILATGFCLLLSAVLPALPDPLAFPEWGQRMGWMLVHSIWQFTILAALAAISGFVLSKRSAQVRYLVALLFLGLMVVVPVATWNVVEVQPGLTAPEVSETVNRPENPTGGFSPNSAPINRPATVPDSIELGHSPADISDEPVRESTAAFVRTAAPSFAQTPDSASWQEVTRSTAARWLPRIVVVWLWGVAFVSIRFAWGLRMQWRLARFGVSTVSHDVERLVRQLCERMGIRAAIRSLDPAWRRFPMVVGYLRPIVLLPACVLVGMTPAELESLIAHELAHIQRHDWLVNVLQVLTETLFFYHPAVWWLSHVIRSERELCCDDLALATLGDRLTYGKMLLLLEELRQSQVAVSLAGNGGNLVQRIERLLPGSVNQPTSDRASLAGVLALMSMAVLFAVLSARSMSRADSNPQETNIPASEVAQGPAEATATPSPVDPVEPPMSAAPLQPKVPDAVPVEVSPVVVRGRIVMSGQKPLPDDLRLQRQITGSGFAEQPKDVAVTPQGEFSVDVPYDAAFVRLLATSSQAAPTAIPRFEVRRGRPVSPMTITLEPGSEAEVVLRGTDGSHPTSGTGIVSLRNSFEPILRTCVVTPDGRLRIPHCPDEPIQIDLLMPGFEEHQQIIKGNMTEVFVRPTKPVRLQLVTESGGPISGATVRLFSRVRSGSFLAPRVEWGDGPVWGTSDSSGRVELTTLCAIDPFPTNDPGPSDYGFRIDAPGMAPRFIGGVRAGADLGQMTLTPALQVEGEILRNAPTERVTVQWRQQTIAQGALPAKGHWTFARLIEENGRLVLRQTGLQPGPFDLFVTYSAAPAPDGRTGTSLSQLQFHGNLKASSKGLVIQRSTITPGDDNLVAVRQSLFPVDDMPPGNLPRDVVRQLVPDQGISSDAAGRVTVQATEPAFKILLAWSATAPVQHSMGYVDWKLFVLEDGTVFVPPQHGNAGAHHRLSDAELTELRSSLDKRSALWETSNSEAPPGFSGWNHGHETIQCQRDGRLRSFIRWEGSTEPRLPGKELDVKALTDLMSGLITSACCGGARAQARYRDAANLALKQAKVQTTPFGDSDWCSASIRPDGTRQISFSNSQNARVDLVHPMSGPVSVAGIEFQNQKIEALLPKKPAEAVGNPRTQKLLWTVTGRVVDGDGQPLAGVTVRAATGIGTLLGGGSATTDKDGHYELHFGPGVHIENDDLQLQVATITAQLPGHFEKNLSRQGDLLMARRQPEKVDWKGYAASDVILPDTPRKLDFVMLPAATLSGLLIDGQQKPLAGYSIALTGDTLPPSSSVLASVKTDDDGRFHLSEIPTGYKFQILVEPADRQPPWNAWASGPLDFQISSGDEFFIKEADREVAANRFELQIKGPGINWKEALRNGAKFQKLAPTADFLTSKSRLHAATIRLELEPQETADDKKP